MEMFTASLIGNALIISPHLLLIHDIYMIIYFHFFEVVVIH